MSENRRTILITGTSQGLGESLVSHYLKDGWQVIGIARSSASIDHPDYIHVQADVADDCLSTSLSETLHSTNLTQIDIVINNAGTGSSGSHLSQVDPREVIHQCSLHCVGALRVTQAALPYLDNSKIVNITSRLGSVVQHLRGDFINREFSYAYRIAKSAQNMLSLCMTQDRELAGNLVLSINPGLLLTASGSEDANHTAKHGARAVAEIIANATTCGIYHAFGGEALY